MKKSISVFLSLIMLLSVFACLTINASADSYGRVPYINVTVTAPSVGAKPVFEATVSSQYEKDQVSNSCVNKDSLINGVEWYDVDEDTSLTRNDTFIAGHTYTVGVLVTTGKDYRFKKDYLPDWQKVNGEDAQGDYYMVDGYIDNEQYYFVSYTFEALPEAKNGWVKENGYTFYYKDDVKQTGWQNIEGSWYYLNTKDDGIEGLRRLEWININGKRYYLDPTTGAMQTGWQKISGKWYYFNKSGAMQTGWQKISNKWYYFTESNDDNSGIMQTGWQKISNKWYYFNKSGAMQTGWQKISNKWYYFNASGAMLTGWQKISNKWYYFNASGAMQTGWQKISGKWYYFESSGAMLANCSKKIGSKTYKFDKNGVCTNP